MLNIQGVRKTFFPGTVNEVAALRDVSLFMEEGCFTVVIGTNGSGKSSLLNAIAGSFFPDAGRIHLKGHDITLWPEYRRAALIGRVFQNPFSGTVGDMSIAENIGMAMRRGIGHPLRVALGRHTRETIAERVRTLKMGLEDRLDNPIGTLSGGQRQALTLLMATWNRPDILLLDEHTAALDPGSAARVIELTRQIIADQRLTALMVTHSMAHAVDLADRIILMHRGQIVEDMAREKKKQVRVPDLLATFDRLQKRDLFDESVAQLLVKQYI